MEFKENLSIIMKKEKKLIYNENRNQILNLPKISGIFYMESRENGSIKKNKKSFD